MSRTPRWIPAVALLLLVGATAALLFRATAEPAAPTDPPPTTQPEEPDAEPDAG